MSVKLLTEHHLEFVSFKGKPHRQARVYTCQNATLLEITCRGSYGLNKLTHIFIHLVFGHLKSGKTQYMLAQSNLLEPQMTSLSPMEMPNVPNMHTTTKSWNYVTLIQNNLLGISRHNCHGNYHVATHIN